MTIAATTIQKLFGLVEERQFEVHPHDPGQDHGRQQDRRQEGQDLHHVVGILGGSTHVDVERAEQQVAQVLDGFEGPFQAVGETGPRPAQLLVQLHLRPAQGRECEAVRGERPADQPDPATQRHDAGKDIVPGPTTEGVLIESVDLALDAFDEAEVAGDDLVDDGRHQSCRVHRAETRLAFRGRVEAVESLRADRRGR